MKRFAWILTLWAFCLGCNFIDSGLFENGFRTLIVQPYEYCAHEDMHKAHVHHEKLAHEAWDDYCTANPGQTYSKDFTSGFTDGFADFLDAGGTCEPPPIPPRRYWDQRTCRQTNWDWSAGFRTGAQLARQTGLRQVIVVPTGTCVNNGLVPVYCAQCQQQMQGEPVPTPLPPVQATPSETVPAPSSLPAVPAPPVPPTLPVPPLPPQPKAAEIDSAPLPPDLGSKTETATAKSPALTDQAGRRVEMFQPCFLNDNKPSFPDDVNPFSTKDISGCAYESR